MSNTFLDTERLYCETRNTVLAPGVYSTFSDTDQSDQPGRLLTWQSDQHGRPENVLHRSILLLSSPSSILLRSSAPLSSTRTTEPRECRPLGPQAVVVADVWQAGAGPAGGPFVENRSGLCVAFSPVHS